MSNHDPARDPETRDSRHPTAESPGEVAESVPSAQLKAGKIGPNAADPTQAAAKHPAGVVTEQFLSQPEGQRVYEQPVPGHASNTGWMVAGLIGAILWVVVHAFLLRADTLIPTIAIVFTVLVFVAMTVVRSTGHRGKRSVHWVLLALIWIVPLVLALVVLLTQGMEALW